MLPELTVLFTSMIPFTDYKLGIPLGMHMGLSAITSTIFGVAGSIIPCIFIFLGLNYLSNFLRRKSRLFDKFLTKLFAKTRNKHSPKFEKYGSLFLILFIILPVPGTGPGTATLIAFIFGVEFWHAMGLIAFGAIIAGALIAGGFSSILALVNLFN